MKAFPKVLNYHEQTDTEAPFTDFFQIDEYFVPYILLFSPTSPLLPPTAHPEQARTRRVHRLPGGSERLL